MKKITLHTLLFLSLFSTINAAETKIKGCTNIETKKMAEEYTKKIHSEIKEIDSKDLYEKIKKNEKFILIDIRNEKQYERGSIDYENLHNIDRGYLEFKIEEVATNKEDLIILYCCTGKRSIISAKILQDMGYKNVYSLKEGLTNWVDQKLPLMTQYGIMKLSEE